MHAWRLLPSINARNTTTRLSRSYSKGMVIPCCAIRTDCHSGRMLQPVGKKRATKFFLLHEHHARYIQHTGVYIYSVCQGQHTNAIFPRKKSRQLSQAAPTQRDQSLRAFKVCIPSKHQTAATCLKAPNYSPANSGYSMTSHNTPTRETNPCARETSFRIPP